MHLWEKARAHIIVRRLYEMYQPYIGNHRRRPTFYSKDMLTKLPGCYITQMKAKKALGIKSIRVNSRHCWSFPTVSLSDALRKFGITIKEVEQKKSKQIEWMARMWESMFKELNYDVTPEQAREWSRRPDNKGQGIRASNDSMIALVKKKMGIKVYRPKNDYDHEHWHWVLPGEDVIQFITSVVIHKDVMEDRLIEMVKKRGWSRFVIRRGAELTPNIERVWNTKKKGWYYHYGYLESQQFPMTPEIEDPEIEDSEVIVL